MYIGDEGASALCKVLIRHKNISLIDLKGNNITSHGFISIFEALKTNFHLKTLIIEWNKLGGQDLTGLESLYQLMQNNRTVTHLDLRNNRINATGAHILSNIIRNNNILHSIDLRWNELGN